MDQDLQHLRREALRLHTPAAWSAYGLAAVRHQRVQDALTLLLPASEDQPTLVGCLEEVLRAAGTPFTISATWRGEPLETWAFRGSEQARVTLGGGASNDLRLPSAVGCPEVLGAFVAADGQVQVEIDPDYGWRTHLLRADASPLRRLHGTPTLLRHGDIVIFDALHLTFWVGNP